MEVFLNLPYYESRLKVDPFNLIEVERSLRFCEKLGIENVIIESMKSNLNLSSKIKAKIRSNNDLNIHFRSNFRPLNLNEFKGKISQFNVNQNIISVESPDKQIQIQAAKDSRVDIISYSSIEILKTINPGVISLTKQNSSFIEFSLAPIFVESKSMQSKNLRNLYRGVHLALNLKANLILNGNFSNVYDLRPPRGLISISNTLLGLSIQEAKKAFGENVDLLIKRSNYRQNEDNYENGIEFIKRGHER